MTAATTPSKSGKLSLIIAIAVFTAALVILLMTAGLGNATQTPEARVPVAVSTGTVKIQSGFETPINAGHFAFIRYGRASQYITC